jgi:transketolase
MGDGEQQEGSVWEAAMSAGHFKLDNLIGIIDRNKLQIDGRNSDVMEVEPLADKWRAVGWNVAECNGNDHAELLSCFAKSKMQKGKPNIILANTLMGKGVKSIENDYHWHGKAPSQEQLSDFLKILE